MKQIHIHILKNGVSIQSFITTHPSLESQLTINKAMEIMRSMYNDEDVFTLHIEN